MSSKSRRAAPRVSSAAIAHWERLVFLETFAPENAGYVGRSVGEVAAERGQTPFDALCDIAIADDLRTAFSTPEFGNDRADWEARVAVWRDGRAVIGASDAGAHLDLLATFNYTTTTLAKAVREHEVLPLEEAVHLHHRRAGTRSTGCATAAAITDGRVRRPRRVRSRDRSRPGPVVTRTDLPTGAARVYGEAEGIDDGDRERHASSSSTASSPTRGRARCCVRAATPTTPDLS